MPIKFLKSPKAKIIGSAASALFLGVLVVFALIIYFNPSYGWFSRNAATNGSGMNLQVKQNNLDVDFAYFAYDVNDEEYTSGTDLSEIEFYQYDLVFRSRNKDTPVVLRFAVSKSSLPETGTLRATIYRDTTKPAETTDGNDKKHMSAFSSSVMRFTPYIGSAYYAAGAEAQYTNVHTDGNFAAIRALTGDDPTTGSKVFTAVNYTGSTVNTVIKDDSITLEYEFDQDDFNGDVLYAYVYITYDEGYSDGEHEYNGLTGVYSKTSGISAIGQESTTFTNDFLSVKVTLA